MIRHVVLLRFDDTDRPAEDTADEVVAALLDLPRRIPEIRTYAVERDLRLDADNAHVVVSADFHDEDGHRAYRDHPAHLEVIERLIRPALAWRSAVQFRI